MPDDRRRNCAAPPRGCGKSSDEVGSISWSGLCADCGVRRAHASALEQHEHSGPFFGSWRRGMAACIGLTLLDDAAGSSHTHT